MLHVRVGNVDFYGHTTNGFLIGPDGFRGWEGSAATKRNTVEREGQHGAFDTPAHKSARLFTLAGTALADSEGELEQLEEVLAGVGQSRTQIVVSSAKGTRWAYGSVEGPVVWDRIGGALEAEYEVSFLLPDSFKYGETRETVSAGDSVTFGNTVAASHRGNAPAHPRFTVTATSSMTSGYQIKGKGRTFDVPGPLNVGSTDKVDFRTGQVLRNGVAVANVIPQRFQVNGGESAEWRLWPLSGAGTATMHLTDTFA